MMSRFIATHDADFVPYDGSFTPPALTSVLEVFSSAAFHIRTASGFASALT